MLKKKRYLVLVAVPVFVALVVSSPFLLSNSSVLRFVLATVNNNISGTVSADSWLIGWQQGILCQNVKYVSPEKDINISMPSVTSNRGLLEILLAPGNLGSVHVDSPLIELSGPAITEFIRRGRADLVDMTSKKHSREESEKPWWDQLFFDLMSRGGKVKVHWYKQDITLLFDDISVDSSLTSGVAEFTVDFHAPDQGNVEISGSLNLPAHEKGWLATLISDMDVKVSSLGLGKILSVGAKLSGMPQGNGVVNADFQLKSVGLDNIEIKGLAELTEVRVSGGPLGGDQPFAQKIHLEVDKGRWSERGLEFKGFEIASDTLDMKASGEFSSETTLLNAQGNLHLPVLFDQFPRFFNIHESTFLETGILDFSVELAGKGLDLSAKLKTKADNLGGMHQDRQFVLGAPVSLFFNGEKKSGQFQVNALQFDAPFARFQGIGDLHSFVMDAEIDLNRAFTDLGMLFQFDLLGSGQVELDLKSSVDENREDRFKLDAELGIDDFMVTHKDREVIPLHDFSFIGSLKAPDTYVEDRTGELDVQVVLSAWLGEVFLVLNGDKSANNPFEGYYTTDSELDLGQLTTMFHLAGIIDEKLHLSGDMQIQAAGFAGDSPLEVRDLSAEITDFALEGNGGVFTDPRVNLKIVQPVNEEVSFLSLRDLKIFDSRQAFVRDGAGLNLFDWKSGNLILHNVELEAVSGKATIDRLIIPNLGKPYEELRTQLSLSADLEQMTGGFHAFGFIPRDVVLSGSSELMVALTDVHAAEQELLIDFKVADFGMKRSSSTYLDSENISFTSKFQGQLPFGEFLIDKLSLHSGLINLDGSGKVSSSGDDQILDISGTVQPDLEKFAVIARNEFNIDLKMQGTPEEQVIVRYPLWLKPGKSISKLGVFSSLHAQSFAYNGIELKAVALPFHFDKSKLHMEMSAGLNSGRLELVSDTDFVADPAVIRTPGNTQIMTGVNLDKSLTSTYLAKIHPLFGVFAQPAGPVDVRLDSFWWPIIDKGETEANFVVIFDVRETQFTSNELLKDILAVFGLENEKLQVRDNEIYCIGKNSRIKCSPVRMLAGDAEIVIGGSVSTDRSLDYLIETPLTKNNLSEEEFQVLEGTVIKVPVSGTVEKPLFDRDAVTGTIQNLVKQAADGVVKQKNMNEKSAVTDG